MVAQSGAGQAGAARDIEGGAMKRVTRVLLGAAAVALARRHGR
jgi:hypothetical protein